MRREGRKVKRDRTRWSKERPLRVTLEEYERGAVLREALVSALRGMDPADEGVVEEVADLVLAGI
jgi:hypothetical protein